MTNLELVSTSNNQNGIYTILKSCKIAVLTKSEGANHNSLTQELNKSVHTSFFTLNGITRSFSQLISTSVITLEDLEVKKHSSKGILM